MSDTVNRTWKTRITLYISHEGAQYTDVTYGSSANKVSVQIVQNVTEGESSPRDIIHSINKWNDGTVVRPHEFTWSFEVYANSEEAKLLRHLQRDNAYFRMYLEETIPDELPSQFVYETEILGDAWIERRETNIPNVGVARITFSGRALRAAYAGSNEYGEYPYFLG